MALLYNAKEESENSIAIWFRRKYNLSPKDNRFLEMTSEEMLKDYFLDKVLENPEIQLSDLIKDKSLDESWMAEQEAEMVNEALKKRFEKKDVGVITLPKAPTTTMADDFEEIIRETR